MPRVSPTVRDLIDIHRARLERIANRQSVNAIRRLYEDAENAILGKLARAAGRSSAPFTTAKLQQLLLQVRHGQLELASRMADGLGAESYRAQVESLRALAAEVTTLEQHATGVSVALPIEEAARFRGVIDQRRTSLLTAHETSMARYGSHLVRRMEGELALSLMTGETTGEAIDRVRAVAGNEWWQAERIVRTETAWAYNATHVDGIRASQEALPDLRGRWNEHVDDMTYAKLDDRVGVDSVAMHGQIANPGGVFVMPPTSPLGDPVPVSLVGQAWTHPPNRPNDRAVVSPWRPGWGIPSWEWRGRRVAVR